MNTRRRLIARLDGNRRTRSDQPKRDENTQDNKYINVKGTTDKGRRGRREKERKRKARSTKDTVLADRHGIWDEDSTV